MQSVLEKLGIAGENPGVFCGEFIACHSAPSITWAKATVPNAAKAPKTPNATTPYQVSPVNDVCTEMLSALSGEEAIAYHVCMNWFPPMPS